YREARRRKDVELRFDLTPDKCPTVFVRNQELWKRDNSSLVSALKDLGVHGTTCDDKFIPHVYKAGDRDTRRQVLAGLLDSDGSATNGGYDYVSKSERLARDVVFIA